MKLINICSVPFWTTEVPFFQENKDKILNLIKEVKEQYPSVTKYNVNGYQSPPVLHYLNELNFLHDFVCSISNKAAKDLNFVDCEIGLTSSWVNINDSKECIITEHTHNAIFSGVFFLNIPEDSGVFVIRNPGINSMWEGSELVSEKNQYTSKFIKIEPKEGTIILFPSYLPHSVESNLHDGERITISFDVVAYPKNNQLK